MLTEHEPLYDCWFQRRNVDPFSSTTEIPRRIVPVFPAAPGLIIRRALLELQWGAQKMFGVSLETADNGKGEGAEGIFLGTVQEAAKKCGVTLPVLKPEGFVIRCEINRTIIAGQDERGCLYGVYRFLSLLALGKITPGAEFASSPAMPIRMINHWDNLDGTIERGYAGNSIFYKNDKLDYEPRRIEDYARLLASLGINCLSVNNVNVRFAAKRLITEEYLPELEKLAALFRPFGIRLMLSINFSAPYSLGDLPSADPLDPAVADWWKRRAELVYRYIPDLAGFLVKADSEGEPGPFQYGRTHADGANMLAAALRPFNAVVIWRCFVYNAAQDWRDPLIDRARAAYDHFMPQDGSFSPNVILQIKHGPYDFQVREPVSPLFGALKKTRHLMELQITQEYTGHQIDLCYLPTLWEWVMNFDTGHGENAAIKELLGRTIEGLAAVGNVGLERSWTGHPLAQANLYGYGRLAWQPDISAEEIAKEWCALTFVNAESANVAVEILTGSYSTYEKYNAPFGVCFMVTPGTHYGPNIEGYEFSAWGTYHRADRNAIGIDRTESGTGYTTQYAPQNAAIFAGKESCPENLILFFHRLPYGFIMKNGQSLLQNIYDTHFEGADEVKKAYAAWLSLEGKVDGAVFSAVKARMEKQIENARQWRDVINTYFYRRTGIADSRSRTIYP
ncbi:xylan alpha-(1-_2)-glucuronosidase [Spirochaetia bacterium]|nr:xylan alpha-(1->2)-glucuronosidase [Spirochaetia bacterium]